MHFTGDMGHSNQVWLRVRSADSEFWLKTLMFDVTMPFCLHFPEANHQPATILLFHPGLACNLCLVHASVRPSRGQSLSTTLMHYQGLAYDLHCFACQCENLQQGFAVSSVKLSVNSWPLSHSLGVEHPNVDNDNPLLVSCSLVLYGYWRYVERCAYLTVTKKCKINCFFYMRKEHTIQAFVAHCAVAFWIQSHTLHWANLSPIFHATATLHRRQCQWVTSGSSHVFPEWNTSKASSANGPCQRNRCAGECLTCTGHLPKDLSVHLLYNQLRFSFE